VEELAAEFEREAQALGRDREVTDIAGIKHKP
jgi:hypothetical protein